jgi:succinyl-diaminopimelate desuccinylase
MAISKEFLTPILQKLIQINTENPDGITKEIVDYIYSLFPFDKGFRKKIITNQKNDTEMHKLIVELGYGKEKIVFCGHLDTVPSGPKENWKFDPFSGKIEDGNVFGRGSADMKGGVTSLIGLMFEFLKKPDFLKKYTLILACTADEEAGMTGAETLKKLEVMENAILLIIPEATNLQLGIAEKGVVWAKIKIIGKAAHGSTPEEGINAIEIAASLLPQFYSSLENLSSKILGKSTLNIGTIRGGNKINIVPSEVVLELDYRTIPEENIGGLIEKLSTINASPGRIEIEFIHKLPALITKKNEFIENLAKITNTNQIGLTYATDAAKLIPNNEIPFIIFGPGDNKIIHQVDEHVPISQVVTVAEKIYEALIETYL